MDAMLLYFATCVSEQWFVVPVLLLVTDVTLTTLTLTLTDARDIFGQFVGALMDAVDHWIACWVVEQVVPERNI